MPRAVRVLTAYTTGTQTGTATKNEARSEETYTDYAPGLPISRLSPGPTQPMILANIYPSQLERFDEQSVPRQGDIVIPEMAGSPQSLRCANLEDRLGDQPFYVEVWALPHGSNLVVPDPGTVGFWAVVPLIPYDIGLVFRQDSVVLQKGWPDATQVLLIGDTVSTMIAGPRFSEG